MIWWDGKFSILWCQKHIILHEIASRKVGLIKDYGCDNMDILQSRVVAWASRGAGGEFIKSMLQRKKHNLVLPWPHSLSSACPHNFSRPFHIITPRICSAETQAFRNIVVAIVHKALLELQIITLQMDFAFTTVHLPTFVTLPFLYQTAVVTFIF